MTDPGADESSDHGTAGLFTALGREFATLLHEEAALARAELRQKRDRIATGSTAAAIAFIFIFGGTLALLAASILGLATVTSPWEAALIVGGSALLIGIIFGLVAWLILRRLDLLPTRTLANLWSQATWAREKLQ